MELESLKIEKPGYGEHKDKYIAHVCIGGDGARIYLDLSPEIGTRILVMCIDELCSATDKAAQDLKKKLLDSIPKQLAAVTMTEIQATTEPLVEPEKTSFLDRLKGKK